MGVEADFQGSLRTTAEDAKNYYRYRVDCNDHLDVRLPATTTPRTALREVWGNNNNNHNNYRNNYRNNFRIVLHCDVRNKVLTQTLRSYQWPLTKTRAMSTAMDR